MTYFSAYYQSPFGEMTLCANGEKLTGLWLKGQKYFGGSVGSKLVENPNLPTFSSAKKWLDAYFAGEKPAIADLTLAPAGSKFRQQVWQILCEIPYGQYLSYGEIARKIAMQTGKKNMSSQAVGGAIGHNPISIIIPCHRVVGSDGSLTGYAGGIGIKVKLLELEGVDMSKLFIPKTGTAM